MASYLVCLTTAGGVPLFTRTADDLKPLPFPVIGSLNGVHMFGSSHDVTLQSTVTEDAKIVWRVFHDSVTLITIAQNDDADDCHYNNLLNLVFNAMVLLVGIEEVSNIKNVEKFKKEIKVCYNLVDRILGIKGSWGFSQLTNTVETIAAPENAVLQNFLDAFTEAAESTFGCLFIDGKIAVATKKWWSLSANELVLLSLLLSSLTSCTSRDIPIYLPDNHPTVPHRLMTFQLTRGIEVCVICGPSPSLTDLEPEILRFWKPSYDSLRSVLKLSSRNFPTNLSLDHNTLGFLLINKETNCCLCSINPTFNGGHPDETLSFSQRREVLRSFYKRMVGTFFSSVVPGSDSGPSEFSHQAMESYITTETHKCYALMSGSHQLFVVYGEGIPTYAMRSITQKTFALLTKDRNISV
ncbi:protein fuzzy homolog isoform X1 [Crassostrea virginica]|uniref:Protein fuzzy homolog n=1 Tax=Crassostrea virginica TaxID=6565 RepID=A0A8B8CPV1_CRAVI|nr:protein fuzzy homolog [Crassostrea virginica]